MSLVLTKAEHEQKAAHNEQFTYLVHACSTRRLDPMLQGSPVPLLILYEPTTG